MYIRGVGAEGLHHLVYEVVDNSVDEALAGHATLIELTIHADGSLSVQDDGRGIPVGPHPTESMDTLDVVMTKLHAGGKFDQGSYKVSGGLHGVGVSCVNALSDWLEVEVFRDGKIHKQRYQRGVPTGKVQELGETKLRGTKVTFAPDPTVLEATEFNFDVLANRMRELAFLNPGLRITMRDERADKSHDFKYEGGITAYVELLNKNKNLIFAPPISIKAEQNGSEVHVALQWNDGFDEKVFSFANNINTVDGGPHLIGFKAALTRTVVKYGESKNLWKDIKESPSGEDVREGLTAVVSVKIPGAQFEGNLKGKLVNTEAKALVEEMVAQKLRAFWEENPSVAKRVMAKLADCQERDPEKCELYIVEGESAGGSAKQGRDRRTQAILPLRGKILNVEKARFDKMLGSDEIKTMIAALGCGIGSDDFDIEKLRYHRIIIMTDADVDGSHIRTLLLTFFYRQLPKIIENGYVYIAQPPLFRAKRGKSETYIKDERELEAFLLKRAAEARVVRIPAKGIEISGAELERLLQRTIAHQKLLQVVERRGHPREIVEALVAAGADREYFADKEKLDGVAHALTTPMRTVTVERDEEHNRYLLHVEDRSGGYPRQHTIGVDFVTAGEYRTLLANHRDIPALGGELIVSTNAQVPEDGDEPV